MQSFFSHGKLLLMGEYAVLYGADAICLPLKTGQLLEVKNYLPGRIAWKWTWQKQVLADFVLDAESLEVLEANVGNPQWTSDLILYIRQQKPDFLKNTGGSLHFINYFPPEWGLGTSSATISSLCRFAGVDPYKVNEQLMGGSGADIATTTAENWMLYRRNHAGPVSWSIPFDFPFLKNTWFVYSGKKQATAIHLKKVAGKNSYKRELWLDVNPLIYRFLAASTLPEAFKIIEEHEILVGARIQQQPIGQQFKGFPGKIKSLGAWGGDFFMALSQQPADFVEGYFREKGYQHVYLWEDFVERRIFS
ncbi:MAG: hypothetical protein ABR597_05320 [Bacteroidales bacterium]